MVACPVPFGDDLLTFPPDSEWRRQLQPAGARRHPGKLHLGFLAWLLDAYVAPGSRLLDPLAGSGSLLMACLPPWGCHVTLNELEDQWVEQAAATWAHLQASLVAPTGTATIHQGDARHLTGAPVDCICTSPPYADVLHSEPGRDRHPERVTERRSSMQVVSAQYQAGYDAVITSPPYGDMLAAKEVGAGLQRAAAENRSWGATSLMGAAYYDAILTSPPYADALAWQRHTGDAQEYVAGGGGVNSRVAMRHGYGAPTPGRRDPAQIGNLRGARYAAAMAAVYAACVPLLRPGGTMIVVLKNIVRDNREVDLLGQAQAQLEALGLRYATTHWRAVRLGPFHAIRRKSRPDALVVDREGALVLRKPEVSHAG